VLRDDHDAKPKELLNHPMSGLRALALRHPTSGRDPKTCGDSLTFIVLSRIHLVFDRTVRANLNGFNPKEIIVNYHEY
jgi:hypothetical protein